MNERSLTVGEVLRYANHDFLNQLQLISMNLQLGNVEGAFQQIEKFQQKSQQTSKISKLQYQKTAEWLLTACWRFSAVKLSVNIESSPYVNANVDQTIASYLEHTIIHIYNELDPFTEQFGTISWINDVIQIHLQGKWAINDRALKYEENTLIQVDILEHNETQLKVVFTIKE